MSAVRGLVVAAPASGSGKTIVTVGLLALLRQLGHRVRAFKVGPDYIDPAYHAAAAGAPSTNLDTWMTSDAFVAESFSEHARNHDFAIVEGVMGLFDAKGMAGASGSTAHLARTLRLPILLVVDVGATAQSAAAVVLGSEQFDPGLELAGVLLNRVASARHLATVKDAIEARCATPVIGWLPRDQALAIPARQLGLTSAHEHGLPGELVGRLLDALAPAVDWLEALPRTTLGPPRPKRTAVTRTTIGVARDEAFCFYYDDNLRLLEEAGARLVPFSPLHDASPPAGLDGLYFGGGFPEVFARPLAGNRSMIEAIRSFRGPILAECGGLMYLAEELLVGDDRVELAGLVPGAVRMTERLQAIGYREVTTLRASILGPAGTVLRGHEFHWSRWERWPPSSAAIFAGDDSPSGFTTGRIVASYLHLHLASCPSAAEALVRSCARP